MPPKAADERLDFRGLQRKEHQQWDGAPDIEEYRKYTFNKEGTTFCCNNWVARHDMAYQTPEPSLLSRVELITLLDAITKNHIRGPPPTDRKVTCNILDKAAWIVKLSRRANIPALRAVLAPGGNTEQGLMLEICRGEDAFEDEFPEYAQLNNPVFKEAFTIGLSCAQHGKAWFASFHERNSGN